MSLHEKTKETSKQIFTSLKRHLDTLNETIPTPKVLNNESPILIPSSNDRYLLYTTVLSNCTYYYFFSINNDYSNPYTTDLGIKYNSAIPKLHECVFEGVLFNNSNNNSNQTFVLNDVLVLNGKPIRDLDYPSRHSVLTTLQFAESIVVPRITCEVTPIFKCVDLLKFYKHYTSTTNVLETTNKFYKKNYQLEAFKRPRQFKIEPTDYGNIYNIYDPEDDTCHGRIYLEPHLVTDKLDVISCRFNSKFSKWVPVVYNQK